MGTSFNTPKFVCVKINLFQYGFRQGLIIPPGTTCFAGLVSYNRVARRITYYSNVSSHSIVLKFNLTGFMRSLSLTVAFL